MFMSRSMHTSSGGERACRCAIMRQMCDAGKKRTSLLLVDGEGLPVLLLELLELLVHCELLLGRETLPLGLYVGQGDCRGICCWVDGGSAGLGSGGRDATHGGDVGGAAGESRARQAKSLYGLVVRRR